MLSMRANGKKGVRSYSPNSTNSNTLAMIITALIIYLITIQSNQWTWREHAGRVGTKSPSNQKQRSVALTADTVESETHDDMIRALHSQQSSNRPRKKKRKRLDEINLANHKQPGLVPGDLRHKAVAGGFPAFNKGAAFSPHPPFSSDVVPHNPRPVTTRRSPRAVCNHSVTTEQVHAVTAAPKKAPTPITEDNSNNTSIATPPPLHFFPPLFSLEITFGSDMAKIVHRAQF